MSDDTPKTDVAPSKRLTGLVDKWGAAADLLEKPGARGKVANNRPGHAAPSGREMMVVSSRASAAAKAQEAARNRCHVAEVRSLQKKLQHDPTDQQAQEKLRIGMTKLNAARTYFVPLGKAHRGIRPRTEYAEQEEAAHELEDELEEEDQPAAKAEVPDEVNDEWRKSADYKEFQGYWKEVAPELKELMKKEPEEHWATLKDTCWKLFPNIKGMFLYYAAMDAAVYSRFTKTSMESDLWTEKRGAGGKVSMVKTVSALEYSQFLKDTGLISKSGGPTSITKAESQLIFTRCNWETDEMGAHAADDGNPDHELMGHEWLHMVLRIAHKLPALQGMPFHRRVSDCVQKLMYPKAKKVDMSDFEDRFSHPLVQGVLSTNEFLLRSAFCSYSISAEEDAEEDAEEMLLMDPRELLRMCRDLCIINESCPEEAIVTSHVLAQQQNEGALETSLNYNRFLWAVTRIADLWNADKYQKLSRKLGMLLKHIETHMHLVADGGAKRANPADSNNELPLDLLGHEVLELKEDWKEDRALADQQPVGGSGE